MEKVFRISMCIVFMMVLFMPATLGQEKKAKSDTLVVVWTSGDIEFAEKMEKKDFWTIGVFGFLLVFKNRLQS